MTLNCAMILGGELPGGGICFASRRKIPAPLSGKFTLADLKEVVSPSFNSPLVKSAV